MLEALIIWLIVILVVGVVAGLVMYLLDMVPMDARFKQLAKAVVLIIAVLIIILRALPLLGVAI